MNLRLNAAVLPYRIFKICAQQFLLFGEGFGGPYLFEEGPICALLSQHDRVAPGHELAIKFFQRNWVLRDVKFFDLVPSHRVDLRSGLQFGVQGMYENVDRLLIL